MDVITDPKKMAERGERIYQDKYKTAYEEEHWGKFLAIDVTSEKAYLGDTPEEALLTARREAPKGVFHLIRVGHTGAFRVSHSDHNNAKRNWLLG